MSNAANIRYPNQAAEYSWVEQEDSCFSLSYCQPSRMPAVSAHAMVSFEPGRLDVTLFVGHSPPAALAQWRTGPLEYGWVEPLTGFPLLLLASGGWRIEAGVNLLRGPASAAQAWLSDPGAELRVVLLDAATADILVERTVSTGATFNHGLRDCLATQRTQARTAQVADEVFQMLQQASDSHELLRQATLYRTKCPSPTIT